MNRPMIFVYDPDPALRARLAAALASEGEVREIATFLDVIVRARLEHPSVVVFRLDTNSALPSEHVLSNLHAMHVPVVLTGTPRRLYARFRRSWGQSTDAWFLGAAPEAGPVVAAVRRARALAGSSPPRPNARRERWSLLTFLLTMVACGSIFTTDRFGSFPFHLVGGVALLAMAAERILPARAARRAELAIPGIAKLAIGATIFLGACFLAMAAWMPPRS